MRRAIPLDRLRGLLPGQRGLSTAEVAERRQRFGPNDIIETAGRPYWDLARDTARDPMIWFLVGTSVLYGFLGERAESITLLAASLPLVGMDAFLHRRTRASTEGLSTRLASGATVIRNGAEIDLPAVEAVPGDLAVVRAGEPFPADGIIVAGDKLQVDESALTGEAYPVSKRSLDALSNGGAEPIVDSEHWGFAGTRLLTGRALLRIAFTGSETVYGEIVRSAVGGARARTPLQAAIASLVSVLIGAAVVICLILSFVRLRQGYGWVDALVSAVTLAVAALPEEFPVVFTFFLGVGVYRLARRQALVRRAVSVENIGRVSCICSDKTGTITEGQLQLTHLLPAKDTSDERLLALAAMASRHDSNDPLDVAILHEARARSAEASPAADMEMLEIFPFTEDRRQETAIVRERDGSVLAVSKGSPELLLAISTEADEERASWSGQIAALAGEGHKVIGCAWRPLDGAGDERSEPRREYRFAGVLAFEDPVRDGVAEAIGACGEMGIHTIMVTGDHPVTARVIAREIGLGGGTPTVISPEEMEARLDAGGGEALRDVDVIARAVPSQKLALVRALQAAGDIVAVTGDGVNDVPALQAADVGIAMGERGTRSAREVAAIVLLDDNFRTIVGAIGEGRQLFRNLQLSFAYLLMIHFPLVISAALIPLAGYPMLYLPIHIIWLEMIIHPTALLVFQEPCDRSRLGRSRHDPTRFFSRGEWTVIIAVAVLVTALVAVGYMRSLGVGRNVEHARAMALVHLTFASAALTAALSGLRTPVSRLTTAATVALTVALVQTPALTVPLHLQPLHVDDWSRAVAGAAVTVLPASLFRLRGPRRR